MAISPDDDARLLAEALADRYTIGRELGRGGMATVYLADDIKHHRPVALKVLRPEVGLALGGERFDREVRIAAELSHPHILPLFDSGEAVLDDPDAGAGQRRLYYVMPYVRGESLRQRLAREATLPVADAIGIVRQVASALDHAHARGVIHRDIKPENILVHEGEAMVADFGIALPANAPSGARLTGTGLTLGTPDYMSPEQAAGEPAIDGRSDVYSLGCVLFELLTGQPPFVGRTAQETIAKRFIESAPSVRRQRPLIPAAIDRALARALARSPTDRFPTAGAFAEALVAHQAEGAPMASVAVLPFLNLSADPDNEFFADGITEDVIAQLSKLRALKVISRSSAMRYKSRDRSLPEIGAALQVATVLEGSVRRAGERVRIVAQLIDVASDRYLWTETYDRDLNDIFAIQNDVALRIAGALRAELSPDERSRLGGEAPAHPHAYQLVLQGRHAFTRYTPDSIGRGIDYFERAIALDPSYAAAYVGVAMAYAEMATGQGGTGLREQLAADKAKDAITRALELDPNLGQAHAVLALLRCVHDFDWAGAEEEFKVALALSPGAADAYDHYGWLCAAQERHHEALALVRRAQELDPLVHRTDLATTLIRAGRYPEALEEARRTVDFEPDFARGRSTLGWAYLKNGRVAEGLAELERAVTLAPGDTMYIAQLGEAYGLSGREAEARRIAIELEQLATGRYVSPYHVAYVYTGLGDADRALDYLDRAYDERAGSIYGVKGSFLFTPLRGHPRFIELLRKMNLA